MKLVDLLYELTDPNSVCSDGLDYMINELMDSVPVVICNYDLRRYAPPDRCFSKQNKYNYANELIGYPPMAEYRDTPDGYDWWFSVFLDCPGIFLLDVFYPKEKVKGNPINIKVRHGMSNIIENTPEELTNLFWIDGAWGLCETVLSQAYWLSVIHYVLTSCHTGLTLKQTLDINQFAITCALNLQRFSVASKGAELGKLALNFHG